MTDKQRNVTIEKPDDISNIEIHPDTARLLEEVRLLRDQLVRQLQEREDMLSTVIPNLEARYYSILGKQQYDLLCLECEVRRIKRKIEMIQTAFNRSEPVDLKMMDRTLDNEMLDWNRQINEMARKLEYAGLLEYGEKMSVTEQKELQQLYFILAKKIHPDLNPNQSERLTNIWLQITAAYQSGNLEGLKALALLLEDDTTGSKAPVADVLVEQRSSLKKHLEQLAGVIASLLQTFPCSISDRMKDQNWIDSQLAELTEKHIACEQQRDQLNIVLAGMISGCAYDEQFSHH